MNEQTPSAQGSDDQVLEEFFQHATPRPRPSNQARERAFAELQGEWQQLTGARRRRRYAGFAVAASAVLAVVAGSLWWNSNEIVVPADFSAGISRGVGDGIVVNGAAVSRASLHELRLGNGDHLRTDSESRVALDWPGGGSLRVDAATQLRIEPGNSIALQAGTVYFDSTPFASNQAAPSSLVIQTALGTISHVGTQFQARTDGANLTVAVREGIARINGDRIDVSVAAGEMISLDENGRFEREKLEGFADNWQWAADIAPELSLNGRTTHEVLTWISRETGRELRYRSAEARRLASSEPRGIADLPPLPVLRTIPVMTSLAIDVDGPRIFVDVAADPQQQE